MSRLVARLLLSMLLFPLASLLYLIAMFLYWEMIHPAWGRRSEHEMFITGGLTAWVFMAVYWYLLWRASVRFTGERIVFTMIAALAAIIIAVVIAAFMNSVERGLGTFIGSAAAPLLWLTATVFVWRESPQERTERLHSI